MPVRKNMGLKCKFAGECPLYHGKGIPGNMDQTILRNVFCYRGFKGWNNCAKYHEFVNDSMHKEARILSKKNNKENMKTISIVNIENEKEKDILNLLKTKGTCMYGNIIKELSISATEGQPIITSLLNRGLIKYQSHSSHIELNVKIS